MASVFTDAQFLEALASFTAKFGAPEPIEFARLFPFLNTPERILGEPVLVPHEGRNNFMAKSHKTFVHVSRLRDRYGVRVLLEEKTRTMHVFFKSDTTTETKTMILGKIKDYYQSINDGVRDEVVDVDSVTWTTRRQVPKWALLQYPKINARDVKNFVGHFADDIDLARAFKDKISEIVAETDLVDIVVLNIGEIWFVLKELDVAKRIADEFPRRLEEAPVATTASASASAPSELVEASKDAPLDAASSTSSGAGTIPEDYESKCARAGKMIKSVITELKKRVH